MQEWKQAPAVQASDTAPAVQTSDTAPAVQTSDAVPVVQAPAMAQAVQTAETDARMQCMHGDCFHTGARTLYIRRRWTTLVQQRIHAPLLQFADDPLVLQAL